MRQVLQPFHKQRGPGGLRFWGSRLVLNARLNSILLKLERPDENDAEILKHSVRRSVLRIRGVAADFPSLVIKGFPLRKIESRLKYRKYGLAEFSHYLQATRLGVPVPTCHGYFEVRSFWLVLANGVIIEDLTGWRSLSELIRANHAGSSKVLAKAVPVLKQLYETGANHVDISLNNLLESPDGAQMRLIDWQYASFVAPRQTIQLQFQASHFMKEAGLVQNSPEAQIWLGQLHQACSLSCSLDEFRFAVSELASRGKITATERLSLRLATSNKSMTG